MKIVTIVGARPQFIKAGSISRAIHRIQQKVAASTLTSRDGFRKYWFIQVSIMTT